MQKRTPKIDYSSEKGVPRSNIGEKNQLAQQLGEKNETTLRFYFTPFTTPKKNKITSKNVNEHVKKEELSFIVSEYKVVQLSLEISVYSLEKAKKKKKIKSTGIQAIPLIGICPKYMKVYPNVICSVMLIAKLFTTPRNWKQPSWISTDEYIMKILNIYTMEYYIAPKLKTDNLQINRA